MTTQQLKAIVTATLMQGTMPYIVDVQKNTGVDHFDDLLPLVSNMADKVITEAYKSEPIED